MEETTLDIKVLANGISVIRISSVPNSEMFKDFLFGCQYPIVKGEVDPHDWAYLYDYKLFIKDKQYE